MRKLLVHAPNWLGDAVMALPLIADLHRAWPDTTITVAARSAVAPLFSMVPAVANTIVLEGRGGWRAALTSGVNAQKLGGHDFEAALLLPNSFASAWMATRAGIAERWGFARDWRRRLLTRAIPPPSSYGHQVEYYQALGTALGVTKGPPFATLEVGNEPRQRAAALLTGCGITHGTPLTVMAPGAAYGKAKQWLPERFAELATLLSRGGVATVLVGAGGDRGVCGEIARHSPAIDLSGQTDLPTLAGVMSQATHVVTNDSGAMHLAGAVGVHVVAIFGPTNEQKTAPLRAGDHSPSARILTSPVWCRPCMLRECPIDHRCMASITADAVKAAMGSAIL